MVVEDNQRPVLLLLPIVLLLRLLVAAPLLEVYGILCGRSISVWRVEGRGDDGDLLPRRISYGCTVLYVQYSTYVHIHILHLHSDSVRYLLVHVKG